jgi:DNA mismatch repair ATPase MutS
MGAERINTVVPAESSNLFVLDSDRTDLGRADTLRFNILTWVLEEKYDRAIQELKEAMKKPSDYPQFHQKIQRYISHSVDLIYAIKAKRNFPGINSLTRAKQQELREKFKEHFRELQYILKKVEKVDNDLRIEDARSTIYVIRAVWMGSVAIIALAFFLEIIHSLARTSGIVAEDFAQQAVSWIFHLFGA